MPRPVTSLSAGAWIYEILSAEGITIFPVLAENANLPYVVYRRTNLGQTGVKAGPSRADGVTLEVACFAETYPQSCDLAEMVRAALDGTSGDTDSGLIVRSCMLVDANETWEGDAFVQSLIFEIKC